MPQFDIEEFYRELDATQEAYVRKKYVAGAYGEWKAKHVEHWLAQREAERAAAKAEAAIEIARSTAFWTKVAAVGTALAAIIAAVALLYPRH